MRVEQTRFAIDSGWQPHAPSELPEADLVLVFGSRVLLQDEGALGGVNAAYPRALVLGCSTAGEIEGTRVYDGSLTLTAMQFAKTKVRGGQIGIECPAESFEAGRKLAGLLPPEGLSHVMVFSDGLNVNGSDLVAGLTSALPGNVAVTGGLAGDGDRFQETLVVWRGAAQTKAASIVGFYGNDLSIGCGSMGGWDSFGPERLVTNARANILHELDGRSALDLYKTYLGEHATGLPATGLLFPLSVRNEGSNSGVVRTILSVDEATQTLTFAGDVPQGSYARLMKANFDRLIDGAVGAARVCGEALGTVKPDVAILISCVGRKMVLSQRIEEEVEGVRDVLGAGTALTGFYSYGEISPFTPGAKCELHNQTMTITVLAER